MLVIFPPFFIRFLLDYGTKLLHNSCIYVIRHLELVEALNNMLRKLMYSCEISYTSLYVYVVL